MVIRYDYLWHDERLKGQRDGRKDRPCAVVVVVPNQTDRVIVAPITHRAPPDGVAAIELPAAVKANLGLDSERSWIIAEDLNRVDWNDPGIVYARPERWDYGQIPHKLVVALQQEVRSVVLRGRAKFVNRGNA